MTICKTAAVAPGRKSAAPRRNNNKPPNAAIARLQKEPALMETRNKAADYPQELLNLFDTYVHGEMSRADFLAAAQKFAVGGLTATAIWESLKPNYAWAQQVPKNDARIKSETVSVPSPKGNGTIKGYLARPAKTDGKLPCVLVIHENRGLNPYIEDVARRLATEGYLALAPDGLTSVGGYPGDDEKGGQLFRTVDRNKMTEDFVAAAQFLKTHRDGTGKLGAVGFCYGGGIVNMLAVRMGSGLSAGVPFYGAQPPEEDASKIVAPLCLQYAALDTRITSGWPAYEAVLKSHFVPNFGFVYPDANHGFHNDTTPRYDEGAAKLAWSRTLAFFAKYVKG